MNSNSYCPSANIWQAITIKASDASRKGLGGGVRRRRDVWRKRAIDSNTSAQLLGCQRRALRLHSPKSIDWRSAISIQGGLKGGACLQTKPQKILPKKHKAPDQTWTVADVGCQFQPERKVLYCTAHALLTTLKPKIRRRRWKLTDGWTDDHWKHNQKERKEKSTLDTRTVNNNNLFSTAHAPR